MSDNQSTGPAPANPSPELNRAIELMERGTPPFVDGVRSGIVDRQEPGTRKKTADYVRGLIGRIESSAEMLRFCLELLEGGAVTDEAPRTDR